MERDISVRLAKMIRPVKEMIRPSKLVPNIPAGPNQNGLFHLMYQPKFPEFWVEWKVLTLSIFILAPELVFDRLFTCSWPMQLWAVLQFSKENSLSAQGGL